MNGYDIYEIIVAIAIPLIATYVYAIMKTHHLRVAADRILYYFSSNMYSLDYYREEKKHLDNNRSFNYNQLIESRNKWYLFHFF